jgi:sugar transferase EpsL
MKRFLDIIVSLTVLVLLSPVIALTALAVAARLGRPVLFRQLRPGLHGRPFMLVKFRTMTKATTPDGVVLPDAERLPKFGDLLRRTSLDELPQLWNVLKGDMSLVGPRPLLMEYLPLYSAEQARRHDARPGITGWAQVNGRNAVTWKEKFELDVWYVDHQSLLLDLRILLMTIRRILTAHGVTQSGHVTTENFKGNTS